MKTAITFIFSLLFCFVLNAQFGVSAKFEKNNYREWSEVIQNPAGVNFENDPLHRRDLTIGVNYWHRLKQYRVEFLPEVTYTLNNTETNVNGLTTINEVEFGLSRIGFQYNTLLYPMDLEGDCNCPTWGKDGDFLKKGLFFMLSPGVDYMFHTSVLDGVESANNSLAFKIGIGGGVDIGISKVLTLSPFVMVNFHPSVSSRLINDTRGLACPECDLVALDDTFNSQISAGIRLHLRPDYKY